VAGAPDPLRKPPVALQPSAFLDVWRILFERGTVPHTDKCPVPLEGEYGGYENQWQNMDGADDGIAARG
jgi:hypothetical protein